MSGEEKVLEVALVKELCPICAKSFEGPIVMNTMLTKEDAKNVKDLHGQIVGYLEKPCAECQDMQKKGFVLIGADSSKTDDPKNPYRTGNIWVITNEAAMNLFHFPTLPQSGVAFIDIEAAEKIGLPNINKS